MSEEENKSNNLLDGKTLMTIWLMVLFSGYQIAKTYGQISGTYVLDLPELNEFTKYGLVATLGTQTFRIVHDYLLKLQSEEKSKDETKI